ncbi:MAG: 16S rRNA (adenine(1518)-N(6)/adenine(1519)-N(6))-dimethyltransferase RsmA [Puniceicoccales bacterium]|jgi:16S rRNA (adenine1518-N6/adenine1519-N6)-dimethyltransferase|nr:16S rRNA (adenine(1518)-N(6)/adenine(1519)-N(6))-dimethyltransferase RsmA [Puniceicoccales bacterium]
MPIISELVPLSMGQTQRLLKSLERWPRKQLGQNFLVDKNIVFKSLQWAQLLPGESVIEIGPGLGSLTRALLGAHCHVFAIEYDKILYEFLKNELGHVSHFHLIEGDAVERPLAGFEGKGEFFKIVANLPYNISTPWLNAVLERPQLPFSMTLMLQREAAARFLAQPGSKQGAAISIFLRAAYVCRGTFPVERTSFWPMPAVDSILVHFERLATPKLFCVEAKSLIRKIFTQRRKQIKGLIKLFLPRLSERIMELLLRHNLDPSLRPEQIPFHFWYNFDDLLRTSEQ